VADQRHRNGPVQSLDARDRNHVLAAILAMSDLDADQYDIRQTRPGVAVVLDLAHHLVAALWTLHGLRSSLVGTHGAVELSALMAPNLVT
jgi:hypothetical protein